MPRAARSRRGRRARVARSRASSSAIVTAARAAGVEPGLQDHGRGDLVDDLAPGRAAHAGLGRARSAVTVVNRSS